MRDGNFPIVLTADRSLMAAYALLLDGMAAASQTTAWPAPLMWPVIAPPVAAEGGRARQAPLGLRRIEAALRRDRFSGDEVAIVPPERVHQAIGPDTRIVGLASGDPLGLGMNSTTTTAIFGGRPVTSHLFRKLAHRVRRRLNEVGSPARIILGGPGGWQVRESGDPAAVCRELGVNHVICGYCESNIASLVQQAAEGVSLPTVIRGQGPATAAGIPPILGPTTMGMVEVSRGCGWGCRFCTLAGDPMVDLPIETIEADVHTNLAGGVTNISLTTEDFFRYGARGDAQADPAAVLGLLDRLSRLPGLRTLTIDHANVSTVSRFSDDELRNIHRLLSLGRQGLPMWVNVGVESAAGDLVVQGCGPAKVRPFAPADWGEVCRREVLRLHAVGFIPVVSLVIGLPGERVEHVEATLRWVDSLRDSRVAIVPMLLTPVRSSSGRCTSGQDLTQLQWQLFRRAMATTLRWLPAVYWHQHGAAGVSAAMRIMKQVCGRLHALRWHIHLRWKLLMAGS